MQLSTLLAYIYGIILISLYFITGKHTSQAFLSVLEETEDFFFPVNNSQKAYITASDFKRTETDSL